MKNKILIIILSVAVIVMLSTIFYTLKKQDTLKEEKITQESKFSHLIGGKLEGGSYKYDYNVSSSYEIDSEYLSDGLYIKCDGFEFVGSCGGRGTNPNILYGDINNITYENLIVKFYAKKDRTDYEYSLKIGRCNDEFFDNYVCDNKDNEKVFNLDTSFKWYEVELPPGKDFQPAIYLELGVSDFNDIPLDAKGYFYVHIDKIIITESK